MRCWRSAKQQSRRDARLGSRGSPAGPFCTPQGHSHRQQLRAMEESEEEEGDEEPEQVVRFVPTPERRCSRSQEVAVVNHTKRIGDTTGCGPTTPIESTARVGYRRRPGTSVYGRTLHQKKNFWRLYKAWAAPGSGLSSRVQTIPHLLMGTTYGTAPASSRSLMCWSVQTLQALLARRPGPHP